MNDKNTQAEPTMEEILASIRRIISEDNEQGTPEIAQKVAAAPPARSKPEVQPESLVEEDVLELTDIVADEEEFAPLDEQLDVEFEAETAPEPEVEPETDIESEMEPEPEPEMEMEKEEIMESVAFKIEEKLSEWRDPVDPASDEEAIMSGGPSEQARTSFMDLSDLLVAGYQGSDNTLEAMVRKMLKPMLKSWLDENLPDIVERVVAREIARLARAKRP